MSEWKYGKFKILNCAETEIKYEEIYPENEKQICEVYRRFQGNMKVQGKSGGAKWVMKKAMKMEERAEIAFLLEKV